jgi:response regulator RpfG family c-di-GMP phosphodiesterase
MTSSLLCSGEALTFLRSATVKASSLQGRRLLIVEDEWLIATSIGSFLESSGAQIVGMVGTSDAAIEMIKSQPKIDAAILDINLRGAKAYPVADLLLARNIPFVISSAYDDWLFCSQYPIASTGVFLCLSMVTKHALKCLSPLIFRPNIVSLCPSMYPHDTAFER